MNCNHLGLGLLLLSLAGLGACAPTAAEPAAFAEFRGRPSEIEAAVSAWAAKGEAALPELKAGLESDSVSVQTGCRRAMALITGQWGGKGGLVWKRSVKEAQGGDKPLMVLHLFGQFDEEFC
jgi:hypothetical protein